jgi:hypothetical protein
MLWLLRRSQASSATNFCETFVSQVLLSPPLLKNPLLCLSLTQMAVADTITALPWAIKPLYGFIDSLPAPSYTEPPTQPLPPCAAKGFW